MRNVKLSDVLGALLLAVFEDLHLSRHDIPSSCANVFLPDMERIFGRRWSGDVPRMILPLHIMENPPVSNGVIESTKEREGLIVVFWDAYILGRERKWAMYSYCADEVEPNSGALCRMRVRTGDEPALLLRPANEPPVAITPWLPKSSAEQRGRVFASLGSFFVGGEPREES